MHFFRLCCVSLSGHVCTETATSLLSISHLSHQLSPSVAACLATDQANVVGTYLKTQFAQRQSVVASRFLLGF